MFILNLVVVAGRWVVRRELVASHLSQGSCARLAPGRFLSSGVPGRDTAERGRDAGRRVVVVVVVREVDDIEVMVVAVVVVVAGLPTRRKQTARE